MKRPSALILFLLTVSLITLAQDKNAAQKPAQPATATSQPATDQQQSPANDPNDPLFGVPPMPKGQVSLVGGTVGKIDRVRDKLTVHIFGKGGSMDVRWDERTHIYRDGVETTERGIQKGDRVYVDTMRDGPILFARNIRIVANALPADARGQLLSYNPRTGYMAVHDDLSGQPVSFRVTDKTAFKDRKGQGSSLDLVPGSLIAVRFAPGKQYRGIAQEVSVIATPGNTFLFAGKITNLDMHSGVFSIANRTDNKTYDIQFDNTMPGADGLQVGADVTVNADFTGRGYRARDLNITPQEQGKKE